MATYRPNENSLVNQALIMAVHAHGSQVRKGNEHIPYVFHPVDVANELIYYSGLPVSDLRIGSVIAILHDVVEDTHIRISDIRNQFGDAVASGIQALTKDPSVKNQGKDSKQKQLEENIQRIKMEPSYVSAVKMADRISNLKNFPNMWNRKKIANYLDESLFIARELGYASESLQGRLLSRVSETRVMLSLIESK